MNTSSSFSETKPSTSGGTPKSVELAKLAISMQKKTSPEVNAERWAAVLKQTTEDKKQFSEDPDALSNIQNVENAARASVNIFGYKPRA